ncbi:MAG TPA: phosphotransferase [Fusibacter sp.]|nr:phosphotransferase [Fusibacter sp.]
MSQTKNLQTDKSLQLLVARAFDGAKIKSQSELTEGYCNAAYKIELESGKRVVLKIAPANAVNLMSYEINMMQAEVAAMNLVSEKTHLLLPKVLYYDQTKNVCDSDYFFMDWIDGYSLSSSKSGMTTEAIKSAEVEIGQYIGKLHTIKGERFGLLGSMNTSKESLFPFFEQLLLGILQDGRKMNINIGVDYDMVHASLVRDKSSFHEVTESVLVHWDTWEGNWLVKDNSIIGLIDWERALYGDPLMEDRFRKHSNSDSFLKGYGANEFSHSEKVRMAWYDVYLYLIMMIEGAYRGYENDEQYQWAKGMFLPIMEKLLVD